MSIKKYFAGLAAAAFAGTSIVALGAGSAAADTGDVTISPSADRPPAPGDERNFVGGVPTVTPLFEPNSETASSAAVVAFPAGVRSAWHTHPAGQTLIVTTGIGWVQQWGGPKQVMQTGDVVWTPGGVKHWHGATSTSPMTHTAIQGTRDGTNVSWLEPVSDQQYLG